jgi:hypothetical protein
VCRPTDFFGVTTYNGDLNTLHLPMPVCKIDSSRDKVGIRKGVGGSTRTYDAIVSAISNFQAMSKDERYKAITEDAVYEILLLTDGGDNCSEATLQQAAELVARPGLPNFNFIVVAVSMSESDKAKLQTICKPIHATFLDVKNISDLQHTLRSVGEKVQQRLVVTKTITVTETVAISNNPKSVFRSTSTSLKSLTDRKLEISSSSSNSSERNLVKLLKNNSDGIMGAHISQRNMPLHSPLKLGDRKLKDVLRC